MRWASGHANGRAVGYSVGATCDEPSCTARIDRGLAYICGEPPLWKVAGCGKFFCHAHLWHGADRTRWSGDEPVETQHSGQVCVRCLAYWNWPHALARWGECLIEAVILPRVVRDRESAAAAFAVYAASVTR